jgi:hypothetical protein
LNPGAFKLWVNCIQQRAESHRERPVVKAVPRARVSLRLGVAVQVDPFEKIKI